jgi:prepilin-type N-terminal cleavage/methylation domain-containing protein
VRPCSRKAFTLVELLIVIILVAVLAGIAILPKFADASQRAKLAAHKADVAIIRKAVDRFRADTGLYPVRLSHLWSDTASSRGLDASGTNKPLNAATWHGPYMTGPIITTVLPSEIPIPSAVLELDPEPIDEGPGGIGTFAMN